MSELNQLKETADQAFAGLTADERLRQRILHAAREGKQPRRRRRWIPALVCACLLALAAVLIPVLRNRGEEMPVIEDISAGDGTGSEQGTADAADVGLTFSAENQAWSSSLWEEGSGGVFPMICLEGRVYRMLSTPLDVRSSLLGAEADPIRSYTSEPTLTAMNDRFSNIAAPGARVWEIKGMGGTFAAVEVEGHIRLFQRSAMSGAALQKGETLADTLEIAGHIVGMELTGVGRLEDTSACDALFDTLIRDAEYENANTLAPDSALIITLDNGLALQLAVSKDRLSACGTWSCPRFLRDFERAVE